MEKAESTLDIIGNKQLSLMKVSILYDMMF